MEKRPLLPPTTSAFGETDQQGKPVQKIIPAPVALVTRYSVDKCRECGDVIEEGKMVWWVRGYGTAHITCGWTTHSGKIHPGTRSSIRDVATVTMQQKPKEERAPRRLAKQD